jgi:hypothetical protein
MPTLSFYARGDGSTANNAALNVESLSKQPTVLITFDSGLTGDIILERNGGAPDPDTTVSINGITYNFIVELTGNLPATNKVPAPLQGSQITVISVVIGGKTERFFFTTDNSGTLALMNQFGNGAISLANADFNPPPIYICFCRDTRILTPAGHRRVQYLRPGDIVSTDDGAAQPILWIGRWTASRSDMLRDPEQRPVQVPAHAIAPGMPFADLFLSAQHRIVVNDPIAELLFGEGKVLAAAKHLFGSNAHRALPPGPMEYFHILLESHAMVVSNGLATESFQPTPRAIAGLPRDQQAAFRDVLPPARIPTLFERPDALPSLKAYEAEVLAARIALRTPRPAPGDTPGTAIAA